MPAVIKQTRTQAGAGLEPETAPQNAKTPDPGFGCVYLTSSVREAELVSMLVEADGIRLYHSATLQDAESTLKLTRSRVLLTNTKCRNGNWRDALALSVRMHPPAALVVAARIADENLWLGVLEQGAYDLIVKPFQAAELIRVLRNAQTHAASGGLRRMTA
jgi:DNA-binding NtrC family response regulator